MQFKVEDRVFIITLKNKGVVKEVQENKVKVTYFEKNSDKRKIEWFESNQLKKWNEKRRVLRGLDYATEQVRQFHKAFNHIHNSKPTIMPDDVAIARTSWKAEELIEFLYATAKGDKDTFLSFASQLKQAIDKTVDKILEKNEPVEDVLAAQLDALIDEDYFLKGDYVVMGVQPQRLFDIVQKTNMSKLWEDGKPRFREGDGKIIKPNNWIAPEPLIKKEIQRQLRQNK